MPFAPNIQNLSQQELGRLGETVACDYLHSLGYEIIERNWRVRAGELDVIVRMGDTVVAVEVKTRRGHRYGAPLEAIGYLKARRLRSLLITWVRANKPSCRRLRVDAIGITFRFDLPPKIEHIEGLL